MTKNSITSGQIAQIANLAASAAREAADNLDLDLANVQESVIMRGGVFKSALVPMIEQLLRSLTVKFNPAKFIGNDWSFSDDARLPLAPMGIDFADVEFVGVLNEDEPSITGQERDERLRKLGRLHLGLDHFLRCWEARNSLPEAWKKVVIAFDAQKVCSPDREPYVLELYWDGGQWNWGCSWLDGGFNSQVVSAVARK